MNERREWMKALGLLFYLLFHLTVPVVGAYLVFRILSWGVN